MVFITLPLWHLNNVELVKDVGMIPYTLYKDYGFESKIIAFIDHKTDGESLDYFKNEVNGLVPVFIKTKKKKTRINLILKSLTYLCKNAKKIDMLNMYHMTRPAILCISLYKLFNKNGIVYMKLDTDGGYKKKYFNILKKSVRRLKKFNVIYSVETLLAKERLEKYNIGFTDLLYIPNGVKSINNQPIFEKDNTIITVGRLGTHQKATDVLLEAFAVCSDKIPNWTLKLIGPVADEFKPIIDDYFIRYPHLNEKVIFTGNMDDRELLSNEYRSAKIFVLSSRWEGSPLTIPEAIANGCYIVATDNIATCSDIQRNGGHISVFPVDDVKALADVLINICNNMNFTSELYSEIINYAEKHLYWKNILKPLYDKIIENRGQKYENNKHCKK
jgi:glycosyltransferase involved in cell wall biosynthesis